MPDVSNSIHIVDGYEKTAYTHYPVLIIGAGESGIALGCRLKEELGFDQFRLFDRQAGLGGTWWINRYPGVACDIPALFYSFSFSPNHAWSSYHPPGPEIIRYLQDVCEKYQIVDKIQLNTDILEVRWLEVEEEWEVTLLHMVPGTGDLSVKERQKIMADKGRESIYLKEEIVRAKIVCSAAGGLVEPNAWPDTIPGHEVFEGDIFHSARWDSKVDLRDKDVIVVGTGCSAAQVVPRLPHEPYAAKSVTQVMRSPPWVVPSGDPGLGIFSEATWRKWTPKLFPWGIGRAYRTLLFCLIELEFFLIFRSGDATAKARKGLEAKMLKRMKSIVPEKYHDILTPNYGLGCKRRIFDKDWLESLNDPKIELTTQPLTSLQPKGVTLGPGRTYPDPKDQTSRAPMDEVHLPADTIILANGFELTTWLAPLRIVGKNGAVMQEVWDERGGPQAYMGSAMDGFPNLFIVFGPNTATGHSSVILASENMVEYTIKFIRKILKGDVKTFEVKKEKEVAWTERIQKALKGTVWHTGGCHSWYKADGPDAWNATAYPWSQIDYSIRCMFPRWSDWNIQYTRKGLIKHRTSQIIRTLLLAAGIVGAYSIRKDIGGGMRSFSMFLQRNFRNVLVGILKLAQRGIEKMPS